MKSRNIAVLIIVIIFGLGYQISGSVSLRSKETPGDVFQHHKPKLLLLDSFADFPIKSQVFLGPVNHLSPSGAPISASVTTFSVDAHYGSILWTFTKIKNWPYFSLRTQIQPTTAFISFPLFLVEVPFETYDSRFWAIACSD